MPPAPYPLEPDDHRRARHLFVLKGLTDRGVTLAHKAADKAEAQLDAPDPDPDPAPAPGQPPAPAAPNHHQTFDRYVRLVRLLIALEHRIANGTATTTRRPYRPFGATDSPSRSDPRRPKLHDFIQRATRNSPERAQLRRAAVETLDEILDRESARTLPACELLYELCQIYGLPFDIARLPDEFLDPPLPNAPNSDSPNPDPRGTGPP